MAKREMEMEFEFNWRWRFVGNGFSSLSISVQHCRILYRIFPIFDSPLLLRYGQQRSEPFGDGDGDGDCDSDSDGDGDGDGYGNGDGDGDGDGAGIVQKRRQRERAPAWRLSIPPRRSSAAVAKKVLQLMVSGCELRHHVFHSPFL